MNRPFFFSRQTCRVLEASAASGWSFPAEDDDDHDEADQDGDAHAEAFGFLVAMSASGLQGGEWAGGPGDGDGCLDVDGDVECHGDEAAVVGALDRCLELSDCFG